MMYRLLERTLSWVGFPGWGIREESLVGGSLPPTPNRGSRQDSLGNCSFQLRAKGTESLQDVINIAL